MKYGWKPDVPDFRDFLYRITAPTAHLPVKVDLRETGFCPPVVNQGDLGSCTGCSWAAIHTFCQNKQGKKTPFFPSRLFIYYNEREAEGTVPYDAGAQLRSGAKVIAKYGACCEELWPYNIDQFASKPDKKVYLFASAFQAIRYERLIPTLPRLRACLASGFPFVFGFSVYTAFESDDVARTGKLQMPGPDETLLGGHAVMCIGYDDLAGRFLIQNSWGEEWGDKGYFTMPYDYMTNTNLADDFWTLTLIE